MAETFAELFQSSVSVVAEDVEAVRESDVFTLLDYTPEASRESVADTLAACRPDLDDAVADALTRLASRR